VGFCGAVNPEKRGQVANLPYFEKITLEKNFSTMKKKAIRILIGLLSLLLVCSLLYVINIYLPNNPFEPIATGDFPKAPIWIFKGDSQITSTPLIFGDHVFIRSEKSIYSVDPRTGTVIWRTELKGSAPLSAKLLADGNMLIVPEEDLNIAVLNIEDGRLLWDSYWQFLGYVTPGQSSIQDMLIYKDILFVARKNDKLIAYNIKDGNIIWTVMSPDRENLALALDNDNLYFSGGTDLFIYEPSSGVLKQKITFTDRIGPIAYANNVLYVGFQTGQVFVRAIDTNTMKEIWQVTTAQVNDTDPRYFVLYNENLIASGGKLSIISIPQRNLVHNFEITGYLEHPVIYKDNLFVREIGPELYMFNFNNGKLIGQLKIQENTPSMYEPERSPAIAGDLLLVPFGDNRVFAYQPQ
jgi:outer membrane protein assembly factor BamB